MPTQSIIWLAAVVLLFIGEALTVGLVSIWFGVGALAGLVVSFFTGNVWIQLTVFLAVSALCLLAVRPVVKGYLLPKSVATNADRTIGAEGVVTEAIDNLNGRGQIKVKGALWTARTEADGSVISAGEHVQVLRIEGVKAIVAPLPAAANAAHQ